MKDVNVAFSFWRHDDMLPWDFNIYVCKKIMQESLMLSEQHSSDKDRAIRYMACYYLCEEMKLKWGLPDTAQHLFEVLQTV
tara:strand:+ start:798 stop:1040 length:243 start_codon:yes stop_codon:yes gene_type:complete